MQESCSRNSQLGISLGHLRVLPYDGIVILFVMMHI